MGKMRKTIGAIKHKQWLAIVALGGLVLWFGFEVRVMGHLGAIGLFAITGWAAARAAWHCYRSDRVHSMAISAVTSIGCWREVLVVQTDRGPGLSLGWLILGLMAVGLFWHLAAIREPGKLPVRKFKVVDGQSLA